MPRQAKPPAPPKAWRREAGVYRSADDRFRIESGGSGRWFVTDEASLDELGLARTLGPYDTLDEAKAAAADQREGAEASSPLAARIAAAKERPTAGEGGGTPAKRADPRPRGGRATDGDTHDDEDADDTDAAAGGAVESVSEPEPEPEPPPRTWLDDLGDDDRAAAVRARRLVAALEAMGVDDADAVVRRDVLGRQPAIATTLLGRSIAAALEERLDPTKLAQEAGRAVPAASRALASIDGDALAAYAAFIAARVLEGTLRVLTEDERADGAGRDLPGWRLVERPGAGDPGDAPRRLIVTPGDVTRS
jgi:hypothetical protein